MSFTHRENTPHKLPDGRILWESRSPAVVGACIIYPLSEPEVLLSKRGPGCPDEVGKFCMPCGYLDWDESGTDGARREIWEETGVLVEKDSWLYSDQPWRVAHWPTANRQNVSLHFLFSRAIGDDDERPATSTENCAPGEVDEVRWVPFTEAMQMDLAFNHANVLKELSNKLEIKV